MKRFVRIFFALLFLLSGPVSAWAECSRHGHGDTEEHHHGIAADLHQSGDVEHEHSAPWFHCPQLRFDVDVLSPAAISMPKPQPSYSKWVSHRALPGEQNSFRVYGHFVTHVGRFPSSPFLMGLSPHVLFSVLRI